MATPVTLGCGYNTFLASAMPQIVDITSSLGESSFTTHVSICTTNEQLFSLLEIDASIAVSVRSGSFFDRLQFVNSLEINATTVVILVSATKVTQSLAVTGIPTFLSTFASASDVFNEGGDSYVSSISTGGQYFASYTFKAYDETKFLELVNAADVNYSGGVDLDASFEVGIANITSSTGITSTTDQAVIGYSTGKLPKPDEIVEFALDFGNLILDGPEVLTYSTTSYRGVPTCPDFTQIETYRFDYVDPTGAGQGYCDIEVLAATNKDLVQATKSIYDYYGLASVDEKFDTVLTGLSNIAKAIGTWRELVNRDPTKAGIPPPEIDDTSLVVPSPRFLLLGGPYSGFFGAPSFQDVTVDMIPKGVLPTSVTVRGDVVVDNVTTTYTLFDPDKPTFSTSHGGGGGYSFPTIQLQQWDQIVEFQTWSFNDWNVLQQFFIRTTSQSGVYYPGDFNGSANADWKVPANSCFVGWAGHAGRYVDGIQPMYVTFQPASWSAPTVGAKYVSKRMPPRQAQHVPRMPAIALRMPTAEEVPAVVEHWAKANYVKIDEIYRQGGAWQQWAQVELARTFKRLFPRLAVLREENVYSGNVQSADITLALSGNVTQVIELRCQSQGQDKMGPTMFYKTLVADMKKITENHLHSKHLPARLWVIGFTCVDSVSKAGKNYNFHPHNVSYKEVAKTSHGNSLYTWYTHRDISKREY